MSVETVINTRAAAFAGLTNLIGSPPRFYYADLPQTITMPAVVYARIAGERPSCMGVDAGLVRARFQFDVYAETQKKARQVVEQLRQCFQRWSNTIDTVVQDVYVVSDVDVGRDPDTREYHSAIDFEFVYQE